MKYPGVGLLTRWAVPHDALGLAALVAAVLLASYAWRAGRASASAGIATSLSPRAFVVACASAAALLSAVYVQFVLRGGPRIIDATAYVLQARIFSSGHATWAAGDPGASFAGRFLVPAHDGSSLAVLFPPGYPLVLAPFVRLGAPMLLGPLLAAAIVVATYALARAAAGDEPTARAAALFSVACACLRYHTADTMAHGLLALLVTCGAAAAMRAQYMRYAVLAGACAGYAVATRFSSGLAIALVTAALVAAAQGAQDGRGNRATRVAMWAAGLGLGVLPLALYQSAAFGSPWTTGQTLYYAASDGPPGCFRYGFGDGIGCMHEHGDVVSRFAGHFGAWQAFLVTGARMGFHVGDVLQFEPLFVLVACGALVLLHIALHAPFYFSGSYQGGGARMFADVLPAEHVLLAFGAMRLGRARHVHDARIAGSVLALAALAFGIHNVNAHLSLRDREGGRPMFREDDVASVPAGALVFVDTDHGFDLAAGPHGPHEIARYRGDDHDRLVAARLGTRGVFLHSYDIGQGTVSVKPLAMAPVDDITPWHLEAESLWPALSQHRGWAAPQWVPEPCAGRGRVLRITGEATLRVSPPDPERGSWDVVLVVLENGRCVRKPWRRAMLAQGGTLTLNAGAERSGGTGETGDAPLFLDAIELMRVW